MYFMSTSTPRFVWHLSLIHISTISGTVTWVAANGSYTVHSPIVKLTDAKGKEHTLTLCQKWPIRTPRPSAERMTSPRPLITGQRVIDTMFPLAKGGAAAIPGGFGTGKTMTQHQIAKWCDADIIIYVGCGERGNEMTQALQEFSELVDPRTGKSLMDRTVPVSYTHLLWALSASCWIRSWSAPRPCASPWVGSPPARISRCFW